MIERRSSLRVALNDTWVREESGDFTYSYQAKNLAEEGIYLTGKIKTNAQDSISRLSFTLPNGVMLKNLTAQMVREDLGKQAGAAFLFVNLDEHSRYKLREFFVSAADLAQAKSLP